MKREPIIFRFQHPECKAHRSDSILWCDLLETHETRSSIFTDCIILHAVKRGLLRTTTADAVLDSVMDSVKKKCRRPALRKRAVYGLG
jgi:hypothetical protein